jgi:hypothetical protein
MEAPSILTISLTLDCDDQQKYDDDTASDYEIFCFHWATVPPAPTSPQSRILFTENRLLPFQYHVRFWPKADMMVCTAHVRFRGQSRHDLVWMSAFAVAIGGKTDMACCGANVRF